MSFASLALGSYPTPVRRLVTPWGAGRELWLKDDGLTSPLYGGNKVRKLELILADATERGARQVVTFGAAGSHHVYATARYALTLGLSVRAVLFPQPSSPAVEEMLRATLASGADCTPSYELPRGIKSMLDRRSYLIPPGGSSPLGARGYVEAGLELGRQVRAGELPEPDEVVVAVGSGGTAAGLAVGLEQAGLRSRVVAAPVMQPHRIAQVLVRLLARLTRGGWRGHRPVVMDAAHTGKGYGWPSASAQEAVELGRKNGLLLDPTYTEKAFATAVGRLAPAHEQRHLKQRVLYWHTLSSCAPLGPGPESTLPPRFRRLLTST
ncbi:MAG: pyridoxal-phosphate dependent enzyme [Polyangiaceae bacterium]|nr:pyridoxal-phosphate dependent enzyme [Polyangiaceae bacterium]MCW5790604.1 pyridoxal-phosphate dependent enzyme [Polyangiaceae bacterium]